MNDKINIEDVFTNIPEIETERLLLRKMRLEDAVDMFEYASDPEMTKYTSWDTHKTVEDSKQFIQMTLEKYENKEISTWGIEHKQDQKLIGGCGFVYWNPDHGRTEIGYSISRSYWNQGLITEASQALIKFAFDKMKVNRVEARCNVENVGSERVMQKLGMTYEGILREQIYIKENYEDVKMYSLLKKEYEKR
ncbi:GNAT family N-acetyltransferase [Chengkuizengella sediminis]|uniref:GNAT family N-acetyltransferase n=1 Tax=Chengkuizengella sediminis TaxID=1885917 RepID=UPI00138A25AD|nr:GNAT family N-acetyltransferase [Chengkuizengella sediminis]NDI35566.1 GNAT family N-acetyltransferase [Chengkuizengella sediminis]